MFLGIALAHGGCALPRAGVDLNAAVQPASIRTEVIGRSVQGRIIECLTIGEGPMTVMFIATIHGDESAGTPLLDRLAREASAKPAPAWMRDRTLVIVPLANPDGFAAHRRGNANGVDLNRNFPASSFTSKRRHGRAAALGTRIGRACTQPFSRFHRSALFRFISPWHASITTATVAALANAMAAAIDPAYRLRVNKLGGLAAGSLGSFAGEDLDIPIITVEFSGNRASTGCGHLVDCAYGPMLIAAVSYE